MKEKDLQREVMKHARAAGWNVAHFGNSVKFIRRGDTYKTIPDKDATGFPDLVMVRENDLLFVELKSDTGRVSDAQALWLADLRRIQHAIEAWTDGHHILGDPEDDPPWVGVFTWYPKDWESGAIQGVLK